MWNNSVDIVGNLTRDPDVKTTGSGRPYAKFTVAVNRKTDGKEYTDWVPITAWGDIAEAAGNWLSKGMRVRISGRFTSSSYTDKNGQKRYVNDITAEGIFVQVYKDGVGMHTMGGDSGHQAAPAYSSPPQSAPRGDFSRFGAPQQKEQPQKQVQQGNLSYDPEDIPF